jgi:hypothetical protein
VALADTSERRYGRRIAPVTRFARDKGNTFLTR